MNGSELNCFRLTLRSSLRLGTIGDDAHQFRVGTQLAVDFGFSAHALNAWTEAQGRYFQHQTVSGNHRAAETRLLDARKQHQLLIPIFNFAQRQNRTALGQRFDHQYPGHYRRAWEVSYEKRFVGADLFDTDDPLERF